MNVNDFNNYISKKYIGSKKIGYSLLDTIILNNDFWFTVYGTVYYKLQTLGFSIYKNNNDLYIDYYEGKNNLFSKKLLSINNLEPYTVLNSKKTKNINLRVENENIEVTLPTIYNNIIFNKIILKENNIVLKIVDFDLDLQKNLMKIIKNKKYNNYNIYFDFRDCMGGNFSRMLNTLELFSTKDNPMYFLLKDGEEKTRKYNLRTFDDNININFNYIISSKTASSAEIFIECMKYFYGGKIYGEKSRGKFVIQEIINVDKYFVGVPIYRFINFSSSNNNGIASEFSLLNLNKKLKYFY